MAIQKEKYLTNSVLAELKTMLICMKMISGCLFKRIKFEKNGRCVQYFKMSIETETC